MIKSVRILLALSSTLFFYGCGFDTFVYLYPVSQILNNPSVDPASNFYQFRTPDEDNNSSASGYFKGYVIYYRIYNSDTIRTQDISDITAYNTTNPTTAVNYLINTKRYIMMLSSERTTKFPLIPEASSNRNVTIRLIDYGVTDPASILVGTTSYGFPLRTTNSSTTYSSFAFADIVLSDRDVSYASNGDRDTWYVQSWVAAYGYDESYKTMYSSLCNLGIITIQK